MSEVLHELIEVASVAAERVFMKHGSVMPIWHMVTAGGEHLYSGPLSNDKNIGVVLIKAFMLMKNVVRYVFVDEAWVLDRSQSSIEPDEIARINREGLADHPERQEVLMFSAEDQNAGMLTAHRIIIREPGRKARLGPLITLEDERIKQSEGRMVGLLPAVGTRQ
jgi:hypothetical protein